MDMRDKRAFTVAQLARASGVTVRTLHHYDDIGLLKPAYVGDNGYRYYERAQALRLQQILFHRELGVPLADVSALLSAEGADQIAVLLRRRDELEAERDRYRVLIETIDRTVSDLRAANAPDGHSTDIDQWYKGFSPEKQAEYEDWLVDRYGDRMKQDIETANSIVGAMSAPDRDAMMRNLQAVETELSDCLKAGEAIDSPRTHRALERHREWVSRTWGRPCPPEAYAGLSDIYSEHPDFRARYESLAPGFADWLNAAMKAHAARG